MATGTGKTFAAFHIIWRLWKSGRVKRILFLKIFDDREQEWEITVKNLRTCDPDRNGQSDSGNCQSVSAG
jgi:type I site-specific restriction endonuclease